MANEVGATQGVANWFGVGNYTATNVEPEENKLKKTNVWDYARTMQANATMQ